MFYCYLHSNLPVISSLLLHMCLKYIVQTNVFKMYCVPATDIGLKHNNDQNRHKIANFLDCILVRAEKGMLQYKYCATCDGQTQWAPNWCAWKVFLKSAK